MTSIAALSHKFLTAVRKSYGQALSERYFQEFQCPAPRPLVKFNSLSFLPKIFSLPGEWKTITVQQFFALFDIDLPVYEGCLDLQQLTEIAISSWSSATSTETFDNSVEVLFKFRLQIQQNKVSCLKTVTTWNVSGWWPNHNTMDTKLKNIRRYLRKGPVCIQETRWTNAMATGLQQRIPGIRVYSSAALVTDNGGLSGGVAILVPTSLQVIQVAEYVPGRILGVHVETRSSKFWLFSVYLHPGSKRDELKLFMDKLMGGSIPGTPCLVAGDFNRAPSDLCGEWASFCALLGVESTNQGCTTFIGPHGESCLDDVLAPSEYLQNSALWTSMTKEQNFDKSGHFALSLRLNHRPSVASTTSFPVHETIPSNAFQPGKDADDYRCVVTGLPHLLRKLQGMDHVDYQSMQTVYWQWWLSEPAPPQPTFYTLRKFIHRPQLFVHVRRPLLEELLKMCPLYCLSPDNLVAQHDLVIVPRKLLVDCFEYIDYSLHKERGIMHSDVMERTMRGLGSQANMWQRLRQSCPKTIFYHGPILQGDGSHCTTDLELQKAMLATREFWFEEPSQFDDAWNPYLQAYTAQTSRWPHIPVPREEDFVKTLFYTKDSSPGPDGIPYSAWRLLPSISSQAMLAFLHNVVSDNLSPPVSVQTWIPKAKLGPTADYFRPLGMPSTFERVVDGTIASVMVKIVAPFLHPSQVVLNDFREPQQGVHAIQETLDGEQPAVALSLDLSKAFERINPWHILAIRGAPYWILQYTKYILFGRRSKQKVQKRLLPSKVILTGVDMGRSFSVLLFCIAMDPIIQYLHQIPGVLAVQGYVDDTTLVGDTADSFEWLQQVGRLCHDLSTAGIKIDPHQCWRAATVRALPCGLTKLTPVHPLQWLLDRPGHPTCKSAIESVGSRCMSGCLAVARADHYCILSIREAELFLRRGHITGVAPLMTVECKCNNKCGILTNCVLTDSQLACLDKGAWGMHLLRDSLPALGLHLIGKANYNKGEWLEVDFQRTFAKLNPKAFAKILHRMAVFDSPAHSIIKRSLAHCTFIQSCAYYPSTYLGFVNEDIRQFRQLQSKLLLGRKWLIAEHCPHVLRWLRIAPACDPAIEMTMAAIGYFLRRGGSICHLYWRATRAVDRHTCLIQDLWASWTPLVPEGAFLEVVASVGRIKCYADIQTLVKKIKKLLYDALQEWSLAYLSSRARKAEWPGGVTWDWLHRIAAIPPKALNGIARFALLRWCLGEDDDTALAHRQQGQLRRLQPCSVCLDLCRVYPFGLQYYPVCDRCCMTQQLHVLNWI